MTSQSRDDSVANWLRRRSALLIMLLALLISASIILCQVLGGLFRPSPPPTPPGAIPPTARGTAIPGAYVAWGMASNAIPPTRAPSDPLAPGNEILGVDCLTYLGTGGDVGLTSVTWENAGAINWAPYDQCIDAAAKRTVKLPDGREVPQPIALTIPSTFSDAGSRWYKTGGHGEPGTADNPFIRLHLPAWMQDDTYRFTFQVPGSGHIY